MRTLSYIFKKFFRCMHMKRCTKISLKIISFLIVVSVIIAIYQWDNIEAIYISKTHSPEEIQVMIDKNAEIGNEIIPGLAVRELTDDEKEAIKNGELSSNEALEKILEPENINSQPIETGVYDKPTVLEPERDYSAELASLIGQVYVLEASFSGALDNLVISAISEYNALPIEKHTSTSKWAIGLKYLGEATSMEASCDQQMATILSQIESVLIASKGNMALLDEIKSAYRNEKILKKNYYLSMYS